VNSTTARSPDWVPWGTLRSSSHWRKTASAVAIAPLELEFVMWFRMLVLLSPRPKLLVWFATVATVENMTLGHAEAAVKSLEEEKQRARRDAWSRTWRCPARLPRSAGCARTALSAHLGLPRRARRRRGAAPRIDPARRPPLDPGAVLATLRRHGARATRVLTAGADADVLIGVRQALSREGMTVTMAWDGARAVELLATLHPQIVLVDIGLPAHAGLAVAAQLAGCDRPPVWGADRRQRRRAEGFSSISAEQAMRDRLLPLADLLARIRARRTRERSSACGAARGRDARSPGPASCSPMASVRRDLSSKQRRFASRSPEVAAHPPSDLMRARAHTAGVQSCESCRRAVAPLPSIAN
jgi:two-component system response regulator MprA